MAGMLKKLKEWTSLRRIPADGYEEIPSHYSHDPRDYNLDGLGSPHLSNLTNINTHTRQREWLFVDDEGNSSLVVVDKSELVQELGVRYRDLRIVDPYVPTPYPSGIFLREKAMVINLESLRCIICKKCVYILSCPTPGKPLNSATALSPDNFFVKDLIARVRPHTSGMPTSKTSIDATLPYELRALESALGAAVRMLEIEAHFLEQQTVPALSRLMQQVSRKELNTIRHSKTSVSKLLHRVLSIKKEIEDLLDDDEDMQSMYLGRKERQKIADSAAAAERAESCSDNGTIEEGEDEGKDNDDEEEDEKHIFPISVSHQPEASPFSDAEQQQKVIGPGKGMPPSASPIDVPGSRLMASDSAPPGPGLGLETLHKKIVSPISMAMSAPATDMPSAEKKAKKRRSHWKKLHDLSNLVDTLRRMAPNRKSSLGLNDMLEDPDDISGVEALLEAYFLQIDYLISRLTHLEGRIGGTEDQLNLEMDHRRNELQALDLGITAFMSSLAFISMIGGVYGMNMKNGFEESQRAFYFTVGLTLAVALCLLLGILWYARYKRLMFIPSTQG